MQKRPDWDEYFIGISREVAKRATCDRGMSGCVIVKNKRIMSTGYVGAPAGLKHCDEVGHLLKKAVNEVGSPIVCIVLEQLMLRLMQLHRLQNMVLVLMVLLCIVRWNLV